MIERMKRFPIIIGVITLAIIGGGVFLFSRGLKNAAPPTFPPATYEYFWGNGCPHCEIVDKFFTTWEGKDKIQLTKYEVWYNSENARLMRERGTSCQIAQNDLAVPFLVTPEGKCLLGDEPIIQFLKTIDL